MDAERPNVIILVGPNGAGKSTTARKLLSPDAGVQHFVNADVIAHGLSAFRSEEMAVKAGRVMLEHLHELAESRASFAFETTLASRTFAPWIQELRQAGYLFHLFFLWLPSAELSVNRVRDRVRQGGHDVPPETIRRRYERGLGNFFQLYLPLADFWRFYDNSFPGRPRVIAEGVDRIQKIRNSSLWKTIQEAHQS